LRDVQADRGFNLFAGGGKGPCHGQDQADLEFVLRHGCAGACQQHGAGESAQKKSFLHG